MFLDRGLDLKIQRFTQLVPPQHWELTYLCILIMDKIPLRWDLWRIWKWNQNSVNTTGENTVVLKSKALLPTSLLSSVYGQYDPFHLKTEILRSLWNPRSPDSESRAKGRLNHNWGLLKCSLLSGSLQSWQDHLLPKTPHSCSTRKAQGGCTPA